MRCYSPKPQEDYTVLLTDYEYRPVELGRHAEWNLVWLSIPEVDRLLDHDYMAQRESRSHFFDTLPNAKIGRLCALASYFDDRMSVRELMGSSAVSFVQGLLDWFHLPSLTSWEPLGGQSWIDTMTERAYQADGMSEVYRSAKLSNKIVLVDFSLGKKHDPPIERDKIFSQANVEKQQPNGILIQFRDGNRPNNEGRTKDLAQDSIRTISTSTDNTEGELLNSTFFAKNNNSSHQFSNNEHDAAERPTTPTEQEKQLAEFVKRIGTKSPDHPKNLRDFIARHENGIEKKFLISTNLFQTRRTQELQIAEYLVNAYRNLVNHGQKTPFEQALSACSNWNGFLTVPINNLFIKYYAAARERRIDRAPYNPTIELEIATDVMGMFSAAVNEVETKLATTRAKRAAKNGKIIIDRQEEKLAYIKFNDIEATQPLTQIERTDFSMPVVVGNNLPIATALDKRGHLVKQFEASINRIENMLESLPLAQSPLLNDIDKPHQHSNPMENTFATELAGLRKIFLSALQSHHSLSTCDQITANPESEICEMNGMVTVSTWLVEQNVIPLSELRARLLPLDLLPSAVIDDINERALDLTGEAALEEDGDSVIVQREVLLQVIASWSE